MVQIFFNKIERKKYSYIYIMDDNHNLFDLKNCEEMLRTYFKVFEIFFHEIKFYKNDPIYELHKKLHKNEERQLIDIEHKW